MKKGETVAIVIEPVCKNFRGIRGKNVPGEEKIKGQNLIQLVNAVHKIHRMGLILRDLRPANIMCFNGNLCCLDMAFACSAHEKKSYDGTFHHASPTVLDHLEKGRKGDNLNSEPIEVTTLDDLHSLIRAAYALIFPQQIIELKQSNKPNDIKTFWENAFTENPQGIWYKLHDLLKKTSKDGVNDLLYEKIRELLVLVL